MNTPEQTDNQPLTRKQMRDIRNTASNPIITGEGPIVDSAAAESTDAAGESSAAAAHSASAVVPLARPAEPASVAPAPGPDAGVDLGVSPLTRRQARQQERIRTASVPVITPDMLAASAATPAASASAPSARDAADVPEDVAGLFAVDVDADRPVVNPRFGSELLAGESGTAGSVPTSFDQLIARESAASGSIATPNALIISQAGEVAPLMSPIAATGEVLITGTFVLPEGLGSQGHALGAADGREADAVLIDGELPAHSSPTPIAASAAISTVKSSGEIIRPPAPEKSNRLMLTLAITAGVLALALVGVLILAFATGVFK